MHDGRDVYEDGGWLVWWRDRAGWPATSFFPCGPQPLTDLMQFFCISFFLTRSLSIGRVNKLPWRAFLIVACVCLPYFLAVLAQALACSLAGNPSSASQE